MKKRQQDFQKVKLKVGKRLPKGRNETKTSFQTRKINLQKQIKETVEEPTLKELLSFMKSTDAKIKFDNLRRLFKYVSDNKDSLPMFFPDLLKDLGRLLQESDVKIRSEAISVLGECAEILTDTQLKSFVAPLTSYLNCMMTHITFQVKKDSLKFLDVLLSSHSSVICQSYEILFFLLNMISCKDNFAKRMSRNKDGGRKLIDFISQKITADEWRMDVLEIMFAFLDGILSGKNAVPMDTDSQKEVYWDAKEALYLPLYLNSGVKPAEFDYSLYCPMNSEGVNSQNFKNFINELICIISAILKGFPIHRTFSETNIKYLSIITQIVCSTGEWAVENVDLQNDLNIVQGLITICSQLLKCFPYSQQAGKFARRDEVECVPLNLGICYFYCMCSFLSEYAEKSYFDLWEEVKLYVAKVFNVSGARMSEKSISLSLKICKILIKCKNFNESARNGILIALLGTLDIKKFSPVAKDLYSFFMDLSLDYDYKEILTSQAMREWFHRLIENLSFMMKSKNIIPNYLNYLKQVCARRNALFMQAVNSLPSEKFIEFLKLDDEDFQLTIIHLIVSLDKISSDFLQDLAETIRDESFSMKIASRFIRLLNSRFSKPGVSPLDQMDFVKFLLNLGCDTFLISDHTLDSNPLPLTDMLINFQQSFECQCEIYPTSNFKRHQELSEVCTECLTYYFRTDNNMKCAIIFIRTIFSENIRYPVHSIVAFIELFKRFAFLRSDRGSVQFLQNFVYSCLLCNSLITNDVPEEHWTEYCVPAVHKCVDIIEPIEIITYMDNYIHNFKENHLFHVFRILLFLMRRRCLNVVNKNCLILFINKLSKLEAFSKQQSFRYMLNTLYGYTSCI